MTPHGRLIVLEGAPPAALGERLADLGALVVGDGVWMVPRSEGVDEAIETLRRDVAAGKGRLLIGDVRAIVP